MTRAIPACAVEFIKAAEACMLTAYADPAGAWTIGYGHTGPEVAQGLAIDEAKALAWLGEDIATAAARLAAKVEAGAIAALGDNQYAAMLSFVFNLGTPGTTIWQALNQRRLDEVPVQMMRFVYAGGVRLQGLANRRAAEVALWSRPEPAAAAAAEADGPATVPPSSFTRAADTPPLTADPRPALASKSLVTTLASGVAASTVAVTQLSQAASPYAGANPLVARAVAGLAMVGAALAMLAVVFVWLKKRGAAS